MRVNGEPAIAHLWDGRLHSVSTVETDGLRIHTYYSILNPDKLGSFSQVASRDRSEIGHKH